MRTPRTGALGRITAMSISYGTTVSALGRRAPTRPRVHLHDLEFDAGTAATELGERAEHRHAQR
ncbi:hypothetical protein [Streptomyces iakyrus]